jgi:uncharacterized Fe-S cluster protein YjdI
MEDNNRKYTNGEITVYWRPKECVHASTCFTELLSVFNPRKRPWIDLNGASNDAIISIVNRCPTRALTFSWNDIKKNDAETSIKAERDFDILKKEFVSEPEVKPVTANIMKNGPLLVTGTFKIVGPDGKEMKRMQMASFCRCGHSGSLPFCDGTHFKTGFKG